MERKYLKDLEKERMNNMTQEEKQLLLKDLSARLPYGVKFNYGGNDGCDYKAETISLAAINNSFPIEDCKPYLRPMPLMTEEENEEWIKVSDMKFDREGSFFYVYDAHLSFDWLNAHHFDYRGLIEKGLALEAPEGMYNF